MYYYTFKMYYFNRLSWVAGREMLVNVMEVKL